MSDVIAIISPGGASAEAGATPSKPKPKRQSNPNKGAKARAAQAALEAGKSSQAQSQSEQEPPSQHSSSPVMDSATAEATCRKLVSVLALAAGFEGITASALHTLTNAFENYTQQMYSIAHSFAELAGRTRPNIHDLQQAFADMNLNPASLEAYVNSAAQSQTPLLRGPYQETIPKLQKKKEVKTLLLDSDIEDNSDSDEEDAQDNSGTKITPRTIVPDHLPDFPSKHSYKQTPVFVQRPTDPQKIRELNAEQSRLVESNLKRLMAAENKVAMAAHKDTLQLQQQDIPSTLGTTTTTGLLDSVVIKEESGVDDVSVPSRIASVDPADRRAMTKLEVLPVVNYEYAKRQQQLSSSNRDSQFEIKGGHLRGESGSAIAGTSGRAGAAGGGASTSGGTTGGKADWRRERRRMRHEQTLLAEQEQTLHTHKRLRQESHARSKLLSMEVDASS